LSSKENKTTTQVNIAISVDKNIKQETIDVKTDNNVKTVNSGRNEPKSRDKNGDL
jgi:osmotically-inducible protein OsmY